VTAEKAISRESSITKLKNEHAKQWNNLIEIRRTTFKEKAKSGKAQITFPTKPVQKACQTQRVGCYKKFAILHHPRLKISSPRSKTGQLEILPYF
jgi:hypothetical protein